MHIRSVGSVDEALQALAAQGGDCQVLAGGTDVMIQLNRGEIDPPVLLHIEKLAELRTITANGAGTIVGSLVTHHQFAIGALGDRYRAVAEAAATVGGLQTQAVGTV